MHGSIGQVKTKRVRLVGGPHDGTRCCVVLGCPELMLASSPNGGRWERTRLRAHYVRIGKLMRFAGLIQVAERGIAR